MEPSGETTEGIQLYPVVIVRNPYSYLTKKKKSTVRSIPYLRAENALSREKHPWQSSVEKKNGARHLLPRVHTVVQPIRKLVRTTKLRLH